MDLLVHSKVSFVIILAALGVADDDILGAGLLNHLGGDLSGIGTVVLVMASLGADGDMAVFEQTDSRLDVGGGDTEHHVAPLALGHNRLDLLSKCLGLGEGVVHLPVAGDDSLTITTIHSDYSYLFLLYIL